MYIWVKASTDYRTAAGVKYKIFEDNIGYMRYESFSSGIGDGNLDEILPPTLPHATDLLLMYAATAVVM